jgi:type 1 glutamine amidotransferase
MFRYRMLPTIFLFMQACSFAQRSQTRSVLIIDGFSNHDWQQTTRVTKWILEGSGLFKVDVSTVPLDSMRRSQWLPEFSRYDVIVQNSNNLPDTTLRWPKQAEQALEKYVNNGGGLYILHSANNSFLHWPEYDKMIGLGWRPKSAGVALEIDVARNILRIPAGEGMDTNHGDRFDAVIEILSRHPINEGYPMQWKTANTEVYNFPRGAAENITILSYAYDSSSTRRLWPVEWVVQYGKGRVYNSSMGHLWRGDIYPPAYRCIGFQTTMIRVTEWLAGGKVTYPVPSSFPTKHATSLRSEADFSK